MSSSCALERYLCEKNFLKAALARDLFPHILQRPAHSSHIFSALRAFKCFSIPPERRNNSSLVSYFLARNVANARSRSVSLRLTPFIYQANKLGMECDRTKPCSACCARGQPKECHFVAEGGDYGPIQQSYELRKLRAENLKLKEELRSGKFACSDDEDDAYSPVDAPYRNGGNTNSKVGSRQKKFKSQDAADSLYFGSPGLVNVVNDVCLEFG